MQPRTWTSGGAHTKEDLCKLPGSLFVKDNSTHTHVYPQTQMFNSNEDDSCLLEGEELEEEPLPALHSSPAVDDDKSQVFL